MREGKGKENVKADEGKGRAGGALPSAAAVPVSAPRETLWGRKSRPRVPAEPVPPGRPHTAPAAQGRPGKSTGGGISPVRVTDEGRREPPCRQRDTTTLSPSREIIAREFSGPECRDKSVAGRGFPLAGAATGRERTHRHAWWEGTQGHSRWGVTHRPARTRGDGGASPTIPRERSRCLFRPQGTKGPGWRVEGSRGRARSPAPSCGDPQRYYGGGSPPPVGLREGGHEVCRAVSGRGGTRTAAVTAGRRDGWPEGMGRASPAAAQMFPRGTPLFCGAPRGERSRRELQPPPAVALAGSRLNN